MLPTENLMLEPRILEAFQTMWGPFPEPVLLIHKDRTVLAVNDMARNLGVPAGIKCFALNTDNGPDSACKRCQANRALQSGETMVTRETQGAAPSWGYWMPLKEVQDVYVHFQIRSVEAMAAEGCGA